MDSRPELKRQWQRLFDTAAPDREIRVNSVELVHMWSESTVFRLSVRAARGQTHLYAKRLTAPESIEARVYELASAEPGFPAPHAFVVRAAQIDALAGLSVSPGGAAPPEERGEASREGRLGCAWVVTETARGVRLADAAPEAWPRSVVLLAGFHERAAGLGWTGMVSGLADLTALPGLAHDVMDTTRHRSARGVYSGVDGALLDHVAGDLLPGWPPMARLISQMPCTLVHGDFHSGNIFLSSDGMQLIDWDSVAMAPGLLDLVGLVDVAHRMQESACDEAALRGAYWQSLSDGTRAAYGSTEESWAVLRLLRALLELKWFAHTGEDYGERAQRELRIIHALRHGVDRLGTTAVSA